MAMLSQKEINKVRRADKVNVSGKHVVKVPSKLLGADW